MKVYKNPTEQEIKELIKRPTMDFEEIEILVKPILEEVKNKGDQALYEFTSKFDKVDLKSLKVSEEELEEVETLVDEELKEAISVAKKNIEKFHSSQKITSQKIETYPGVTCWQKAVGIEKVGLYVPGGSAPLFSTALMLGVPATLAGCKEVSFVTPPMKDGKVHPATLYAMKILGIKNIFKLGGAQAIGALIFGTETIPKVDKIFGPGNQFVTASKQLAQKYGVAIDLPAGPSEVAVLVDKSANPSFVASDLLSQAEHGEDSQVLLVSDKEEMINNVLAEIKKQLEELPRKETAMGALENSKAVLIGSLDDGIKIINEYAPEHLIIQTENPNSLAGKIINAGSIFIGQFTPESAGDYASGTNHVLPTGGWAKAMGGVNLDSFVKKITFQEITEGGIKNLGPRIEKMAEAEGLEAHKNAVSLRIKS